MGWKKGNPGCPCCCDETPDCTLFQDEGNSSDYTQVSGTWTWPLAAIETGDDNAVLLYKEALPDDHQVVAAFYLPPYGHVGEANYYLILFAYKDSSNYLYGQLKIEFVNKPFVGLSIQTTFSIRQVIGGVDTEVVAAAEVSPPTKIQICFLESTRNVAYILTDSGEYETRGSATAVSGGGDPFGNYAGLGTKTLTITDFLGNPVPLQAIGPGLRLYSSDENCDHCFCNVCDVGTTPSQITVEFEGVANSGCTLCDDFNTNAFVLDRVTTTCNFLHSNLWETVGCVVGGTLKARYAEIKGEILCLVSPTRAIFRLTVRYLNYTVYRNTIFEAELGCCKLDCLATLGDNGSYGTGLALTYIGTFLDNGTPSSDPACDWSNALARITAVS